MPKALWKKMETRTKGLLLLYCICFALLPQRAVAAALGASRGVMQTKRGEVLYTKPPAASTVANIPQPLELRDQLAVGESSWAILRFQDASEVKVRELTQLEIVEPTVLQGASFRLIKGEVYFSGLQQSRQIQVDTPHGKITPDGTEMLIRVTDAETEVLMFQGEAGLSNPNGAIVVKAGEQGVARIGEPPRLRAAIEARNIVQWWLYYPGVLDPLELGLNGADQPELVASLQAYVAGDLQAALEKFPGYPSPRNPATDAERIYLAGLLLSLGAVDRAETQLSSVSSNSTLVSALRLVIAAVTRTNFESQLVPRSASEWLGLSYFRQATNNLPGALEAAREAVNQSPKFAFALTRVAELEFAFGRIRAARAALDRSLELAPRNAQAHALRGFLFSAGNRLKEAQNAFEEAIRLDPGLANGWLGRGLIRIRRGDSDEGLADLQTAAAMEPNRAFLRSYLAKAYSHDSRFAPGPERQEMLRKAAEELVLAKELDPYDPTAYLYSALLKRDDYRFNEAVEDLEKSLSINDNRQVYRSAFLLDQDRAVRSSSLANVYSAAGLRELSIGEAARAVADDYANPSAHMFVSDSYSVLRDPARVNLRYETPWFSERLLAYLLGPVGSTPLSQNISQQEYSRLFEANRLGFNSLTDYRSDGQYHQQASQFGLFDGTSYALDLDYRHHHGVRPNNELNRIEWYSAINQQITENDSLFLQAKYQDLSSGDNFQYFDPRLADPDFKFEEKQQPWIIAGYHHTWRPGVHTLLLVGRLENGQQIEDLNVSRPVVTRNQLDQITGFSAGLFDMRYQNEFEVYLGELNQIFQTARQTIIFGTRIQSGGFTASDSMAARSLNPALISSADSMDEDFARASGYAYYTLEPIDHLFLTAGISYDHLIFPENFRLTPVSDGEQERDSFNPKAAIVWSPLAAVTFRGAYARSLGGAIYDESVRLEPTQLAGFNQSFRSIISESVVGPVTGPQYETAGAAMDVKLKTRTYMGFEFQWLSSDVERERGVFEITPASAVAMPSSLEQRLDYDEHSAAFWISQLVGTDWNFGARYQFTRSDLDTSLPEVPIDVFAGAETSRRADLHHVTLFGRYQHPSGFFALTEWDWYHQSNSEFAAATSREVSLPGDTFNQANAFVGYRFPRQLGELSIGVLNIGGGDYRLDPLNVYAELPRERVFMARLLLNF